MSNEFRAFVGNLPFSSTEADLREFFSGLDVTNVQIVHDRETNRPRGFAFVSFGSMDGLSDAIGRSGQGIDGRAITVNEARARPSHAQKKGRDKRDDYSDSWKGKRR